MTFLFKHFNIFNAYTVFIGVSEVCRAMVNMVGDWQICFETAKYRMAHSSRTAFPMTCVYHWNYLLTFQLGCLHTFKVIKANQVTMIYINSCITKTCHIFKIWLKWFLLVFHRKDLCDARPKPEMSSYFQMRCTLRQDAPHMKLSVTRDQVLPDLCLLWERIWNGWQN